MSKHTPTPWNYDGKYYITNASGLIASTGTKRNSDEDKANAAYIVKACNAFPDLVEALEFCRSKIGQPHSIEIKDDLEKIDTLLHSLKSEG